MIERQKVYGVRELGVAGALTWLLFACSGKVLLGEPASTGGAFAMAGAGGSAGSGRSGAAGAVASGGFASGAGGVGTGAFGGAVISGGSTSYAGNGSNGVEVLLPIDATGFMSYPYYGAQGPWYAYGDGLGPDGFAASGDCEKAGHPLSECAEISSPQLGLFANVGGQMRTFGVVEQIGNLPGTMGCPMIYQSCDYSSQWGAGIGVDLNNSGGAKQPFNAAAYGVIGIAFDIDTVPLSGLRVELPTPTTSNAPHVYLPGGAASNFLSPLVPGHNRVLFTDLAQPDYVSTPTAFDPSLLLSVQFHVPTSTAAAGSYDFTISNFGFIVVSLGK